MTSGASDAPSPGSDAEAPHRLMAEMAEWAGGLAHELRNPLSTLMVNLKLLAEDLDELDRHPTDARRRAQLKIEVLKREAERLQVLFDRFLTLAGPYHLEQVEADVNTIVGRLAEFFKPTATDHGVDVRLSLSEGSLLCRVDSARLRQALLNLLINAQQAMPEGGELRVATGFEGDDVVVAVTDSGIGIAEEDASRILRPFFSTKAQGNGLGLSITQRIIREHGGTLSFESRPDHGTTFTIRLPRTAPS